MAKKKAKKTKPIAPTKNPPPPEGVSPPPPPPGPPKTVVERFVDGGLENKKLMDDEMKKLMEGELADREKQIRNLSELLQKRDKEIVGLRDENDKLRLAQHYGHFN